VQDNGVGAAPDSVDANGGFGLLGLRERLALVGGQVTLTTAPGQGFTLFAEAPA
jgi:signal transduction histidine kinase